MYEMILNPSSDKICQKTLRGDDILISEIEQIFNHFRIIKFEAELPDFLILKKNKLYIPLI